MSEPKSVLVAVADNKPIKQQGYDNMSIVYHTDAVVSLESQSNFLNSIRNIDNNAIKDFYCFMSPNSDFTNNDSLKKIIDFFNNDEYIGIVLADSIHQYDGFSSYQYTHPNILDSDLISFCIRGSILERLEFSNKEHIFQKALYDINQKGHVIFHIAEPLFTIHKEGSA